MKTECELFLIKSELSLDKTSSSASLQTWPSILAFWPFCLQWSCFIDKLLRLPVPSNMGKASCVEHTRLACFLPFTLPNYWALGMSNALLEPTANRFFPCRFPVETSLNDSPYPPWLQQLLDQVKALGGFFLEKITFEQPWALYIQVPVPISLSTLWLQLSWAHSYTWEIYQDK